MALSPQSGFSLIEILISVLVMSVGLLGLGGLQLVSVKGVNSAHSNNIASMLSMELGERMRSNPTGVEGGFYASTINCNVKQTQCRGTQVCTPQETALFDLEELACGTIVDSKRQGGARNLLPLGILNISCVGGCDQPKAVHDLTISWGESKIHKKLTGNLQDASLTVEIIP